MENQNEHLDALKDIRSMMERSSKFVSLNGFAGVFVGIFALCGAFAAYIYIELLPPGNDIPYYAYLLDEEGLNWYHIGFFALDALLVLCFSLVAGSWMAIRKAKKEGLKIWDKTAQRLFINMMIPLLSGGVFCLIMVFHRSVGMVAPAMLIFYGLALVNSSKYTFEEIRFLGITEIILGLLATFFIGYGLLFWAIGFGVMHIVYGIIMYFKYEK